ncbi:hypothetical protein STENM223S_10013 [Streptomyces tendae]
MVSTWSAYWVTGPSGRPVMAMVVAPRSKATRSGSITSPVEPECVIARATSPARSCTALVTARCVSPGAWAMSPMRSIFWVRSWATRPEAPMPYTSVRRAAASAATAAPSWTVSRPAAVSASVCCSS